MLNVLTSKFGIRPTKGIAKLYNAMCRQSVSVPITDIIKAPMLAETAVKAHKMARTEGSLPKYHSFFFYFLICHFETWVLENEINLQNFRHVCHQYCQ